MDKCVDEFLLVGVACGDRLSVDAVDDYVVAFHLFRGVAFYDVEDYVLGQFVVA